MGGGGTPTPHPTVQTIKNQLQDTTLDNEVHLVRQKAVQYHKAMQFRHAHRCSAELVDKKIQCFLLDKEVRHQMRCSLWNTYDTYKRDKCQFTQNVVVDKIKIYTYIYCMSYLYKIHIHIQIRPHTLLQKEQEKTQRQKKKSFSYIIYLSQHTHTQHQTLVLVHAQAFAPVENSAQMTVTASATASAIATGK